MKKIEIEDISTPRYKVLVNKAYIDFIDNVEIWLLRLEKFLQRRTGFTDRFNVLSVDMPFWAIGTVAVRNTRFIKILPDKVSGIWKSWKNSVMLFEKGLPVPEPIAFIRTDTGFYKNLYFIEKFINGAVRLSDILTRAYYHTYDAVEVFSILRKVACSVKKMHNNFFIHYDLGNQNILIIKESIDSENTDVMFVDLSRGRFRRIGIRHIARDLSRLSLPQPLFDFFNHVYWEKEIPFSYKIWFGVYRIIKILKSATKPLRHPLRYLKKAIFNEPEFHRYPPLKEIWLWDKNNLIPVTGISNYRPVSLSTHIQNIQYDIEILNGKIDCGAIFELRDINSAVIEKLMNIKNNFAINFIIPSFYDDKEIQAYHQLVSDLGIHYDNLMVTLVHRREDIKNIDQWSYFLFKLLSKAVNVKLIFEPFQFYALRLSGFFSLYEYRKFLKMTASAIKSSSAEIICSPSIIFPPARGDFKYIKEFFEIFHPAYFSFLVNSEWLDLNKISIQFNKLTMMVKELDKKINFVSKVIYGNNRLKETMTFLGAIISENFNGTVYFYKFPLFLLSRINGAELFRIKIYDNDRFLFMFKRKEKREVVVICNYIDHTVLDKLTLEEIYTMKGNILTYEDIKRNYRGDHLVITGRYD